MRAMATTAMPALSPMMLAALTLACAYAGERGKATRAGRALSGPVSAMVLGALAATTGAFAGTDGAAAASHVRWELGEVQKVCARVATPMLLCGADARETATSTKTVFAPFCVGIAATMIGACVATCVVFGTFGGGALGGGLGDDAWKLAAALTAKNIGGGLNYVAVASTLKMSSSAFVAGIACDNVFALIYFPLVSFMASKHNGVAVDADSHSAPLASASAATDLASDAPPTSVEDVLGVACASCVALALGQLIAPNAELPATTALTVLFATCAPKSVAERLSATGRVLGDAALFVFFVIAGASGASLASLRPSLVGFLAILYACHLTIMLAASRVVFVDDPRVALLASNACVGGPATAAALARSARWHDLRVPAVLCGQCGNAIATFLALALVPMFRRLVVGASPLHP